MNKFERAVDDMPLIAILRGVDSKDATLIGETLIDAGFRILEVPMNSPDPIDSIKVLSTAFGKDALIGAGTVTTSAEVTAVATAGGRLIVMPHASGSIIRQAHHRGMFCVPGVATPSEALDALAAGADALKMFPAEALPPAVVKAWRAILPKEVMLMPVGSVTIELIGPYLDAGASGFGLGSALFQPGLSKEDLERRAAGFVEEIRRHRSRSGAKAG